VHGFVIIPTTKHFMFHHTHGSLFSCYSTFTPTPPFSCNNGVEIIPLNNVEYVEEALILPAEFCKECYNSRFRKF
jgi:hypothetical protein